MGAVVNDRNPYTPPISSLDSAKSEHSWASTLFSFVPLSALIFVIFGLVVFVKTFWIPLVIGAIVMVVMELARLASRYWSRSKVND
jgi:hypothetical protein